MESERNLLFIDVDTQIDFMLPYGRLYVQEAEQLLPILKQLTGFARAHRIPIVSSADAHGADDPEFKQFPPHCVKGTPGQQKVPETLIPSSLTVIPEQGTFSLPSSPVQVIVEKSSFDIFSNPNTEAVLWQLNRRQLVIYGVATDYCVRAAALGARARGYEVKVVEDAIKGITPEDCAKALEEMRRAGSEIISARTILESGS
jgi:nicotinamidase/pyrazinamidase